MNCDCAFTSALTLSCGKFTPKIGGFPPDLFAAHESLYPVISGSSSSPANKGLAAALLLTCAFAMFAVLDTSAKFAGQSVSPLEVTWFRYATHILFACLYFRVWSNRSILKTKRPVLQIVRGLFLLGATYFNFLALRHLQLAETVSIMFAAPFVVTALAGPLLNEWAGPRRWGAIVVGFIGVLVITQPGSGPVNWAIILSVASMFCYAFYALMTRKLAGHESNESMLMWSAAVAFIILTPMLPEVWITPPNATVWALLLATGFFGAFGHLMLIRAYGLADAPTLAPFMYTHLIWMVALGYLVFGDVPGPSTMIGAAIIISSGLYLLYRERKVGAKA